MNLLSPDRLAALLHHVSPVASILAGGLGMFMPAVVAFISQPRFSKRQKALLSVVSCVVASAIVCLASNAFDGLNWFASLFILLQVTWQFYTHLYKPTGLSDKFEKVTVVSRLVARLIGGKTEGAMAAAGRYVDTVNTVDGADTVEMPDVPTDTPNVFK